MYYARDLEEKLIRFAKFPVIALLGPRQSGKTTLARHFFKNHVFLNLEDLELRAVALADPKGFLRKYDNKHGIIIDEFQNCPELLSYIQVLSDEYQRPGYFVLTGSQNFLVNDAITQSLAGRVGILTLLPLSLHECEKNKLLTKSEPEKIIFNGSYPRLYQQNNTPQEIYPSYIHTYLERDVRQITTVQDLGTFRKFIKLCASRIGQLLNYTDLATQCGISVPTARQWISILEASYIIFLLRPHWENFNKRVTKTAKLYFYDTGILCSLLEIESEKTLLINPYYGNIFENFIIADLYKQYYNQGLEAPLYFWRDQNGTLEVDCIVEYDGNLVPLEIKSGETYTPHFFDGLKKWMALKDNHAQHAYVIYGGTQSFTKEHISLIPWHATGTLISTIKHKKES